MANTLVNPFIFALYFLAILAFSLLKRKSLPGKVTYLFRALLPSWRFFEDFDEAPTLYFRHGQRDLSQDLEPWSKCLNRPARRFYHVLYSPEANYIHAAGSLVQHLLSEVNDLQETNSQAIEGLVSYQLAKNLVKYHLPEKATRYQFKVSGVSEDLLISPIYGVEESQT
jgi:hypothetical protein